MYWEKNELVKVVKGLRLNTDVSWLKNTSELPLKQFSKKPLGSDVFYLNIRQ